MIGSPPVSDVPGPQDIQRLAFPNGLTVLSRANFTSPSVLINGYVRAGSLFEADNQAGLANFTARALLRGTQDFDFQEIYGHLESVGASLGFGAGAHSVGFSGICLTEDLDLLLGILASALRRPLFPTEQVERLRTQILSELAIMAQDTAYRAGRAFDQLVYPDHPYSRPDDGTPESIRAISCENLEVFHSRVYGPAGMVIVIVGGIEPQLALEKSAAFLGSWTNPLQAPATGLPELKPLASQLYKMVHLPGKYQADLVVGAAGPAFCSPDYLAAALGNNILGQFGMMGRIGMAVREQAGLAYYAESSLGGGEGPGPWTVQAGVDPENVKPALELILGELERFSSLPVDEDELADSQAHFIGRLPLSFETNSGVAAALLGLERFNLGLDYFQYYPDLVRAISQTQILETAQRYLSPDRLAIAIAGPLAQ